MVFTPSLINAKFKEKPTKRSVVKSPASTAVKLAFYECYSNKRPIFSFIIYFTSLFPIYIFLNFINLLSRFRLKHIKSMLFYPESWIASVIESILAIYWLVICDRHRAFLSSFSSGSWERMGILPIRWILINWKVILQFKWIITS